MANTASGKSQPLILQLRRLAAQAEAPDLAGDRARILALVDDVQAVQRRIKLECERLGEEMRQASARVHAATAYIRCAKSTQMLPYRSVQQSNGASS